MKDGDDARILLAEVLGQCVAVTAMICVGLIWALTEGWQLTLVGVGIAPTFAAAMTVQTILVTRYEERKRCSREAVSKSFYEVCHNGYQLLALVSTVCKTISNIRCIRTMSFESAFKARFDKATDDAFAVGVQGAFIGGSVYSIANALIYLAEALLFYVGAVLLSRGTYSYLQMVEVLNLVIFTVTIGSQLIASSTSPLGPLFLCSAKTYWPITAEKIAKSVQAMCGLNRLLTLSSDSDESRGLLRSSFKGPIIFDGVTFSYPERPDVVVLNQLSMKIACGECVAIVGPSGSGKSTIAAILQRLYEPNSGCISVGSNRRSLNEINVSHLRTHVSVVSQDHILFNTTIAENIAYGSDKISGHDIKQAAIAANVHDFIVSLPQHYNTRLGENNACISAGQAQRMQIARALARPSSVLILDECTSNLDPANEAAVVETILHAKVGRITIIITHNHSLMRICDRILVMHGGKIKEDGTYPVLMAHDGVFAQMAHSEEPS
jgi:ATP-binding cassette subfamily B (MDR/TAP) protein 1